MLASSRLRGRCEADSNFRGYHCRITVRTDRALFASCGEGVGFAQAPTQLFPQPPPLPCSTPFFNTVLSFGGRVARYAYWLLSITSASLEWPT